MTKYKDALLKPFLRTDGATLGGDIVTGVGNTVPTRPAIDKEDVLAVPTPTSPHTTRPDGTRLVGDMVSGMPKVTENRGVPDLGPVEWNDNGSPADPTRQL